MIDKEIAGFYYTSKGFASYLTRVVVPMLSGLESNEISHIYVGNFQNNDAQEAYAIPRFHSVRPDLVGKLNINTAFHTHLSRFPESAKLVPSRIGKGNDMTYKAGQTANGIKRFIILTTGYSPIEY